MDDNKKVPETGRELTSRPIPEVLNGKGKADDGKTADSTNAEVNADNNTDDTADTYADEYITEDNKKRGTYLAVTVFIILAVAAAAVTAAAIYFNPKNVVERAVLKTAEEIIQRPVLFDRISLDDCTFMDDNKGSMLIAASVNDNTFEKKANGAGGKLTFDIDAGSSTFRSNVSATYGGAELINFNIYSDNKVVCIAAPALFDEIFRFDADNVMTQLRQSELCPEELKQSPISDFSLKLFDENNNVAENADVQQFKSFCGKLETVWENNTRGFEKNIRFSGYDNMERTIGGKSADCDGYLVTIDGDAVKNAVISTLDEVSKTDEFKNMVGAYLIMQYTENTDLWSDYSTPVEYSDAVLDNMDKLIAYVKQYIDIDDIKIYIYTYDGCIVSAAVSTQLNGMASMNIDMTADFTGTDNIFDSADARLTFSNADTTVVYEYSDRAIEVNDVVENMLSLKQISDGDEIYSLELLSSYNTKRGDFNGSVTADAIYSNTVTLTADGIISADDDKFAVNLDSLCLKQNDSKLDIAFDFELSKLLNDIAPPEGEVLEIFGEDSDRAYDIIQDSKEKLLRLYMKAVSKLNNG